jgi:hypothetical protein
MQLRTRNHELKIASDGNQPVVSLAIAPRNSAGYLVAGVGLGLAFGFLVGAIFGATLGDKSLLLIQDLWNRASSVNSDGQRVHFELLLQ